MLGRVHRKLAKRCPALPDSALDRPDFLLGGRPHLVESLGTVVSTYFLLFWRIYSLKEP
jgi:hypothetical protein